VDAQITFVLEGGKATKLVLHQGGRDMPAPRIGDLIMEKTVEREIVELPAELFDPYVGEYELAPGFVLTVWREGGRFLTQATGQQQVEIYPASPTKFFLKVVEAEIDFNRDGSGKVTGLVLHQNGRDMPALKKE
jgi:hypothetical protein